MNAAFLHGGEGTSNRYGGFRAGCGGACDSDNKVCMATCAWMCGRMWAHVWAHVRDTDRLVGLGFGRGFAAMPQGSGIAGCEVVPVEDSHATAAGQPTSEQDTRVGERPEMRPCRLHGESEIASNMARPQGADTLTALRSRR